MQKVIFAPFTVLFCFFLVSSLSQAMCWQRAIQGCQWAEANPLSSHP